WRRACYTGPGSSCRCRTTPTCAVGPMRSPRGRQCGAGVWSIVSTATRPASCTNATMRAISPPGLRTSSPGAEAMPQISNLRTIRSPHGSGLTAKSWLTEAPMRMLMNNLDPEVAERPGELIVYGGIGRAARDWDSYDRIVATLRRLEADQTLLV